MVKFTKCTSRELIFVLKFRSGLSRKISDASSGSNNRKYCLAYPKPKESVHSSFEPEIYSPPEVTDTETSDLFQTADNIEIIQTPIVCTLLKNKNKIVLINTHILFFFLLCRILYNT